MLLHIIQTDKKGAVGLWQFGLKTVVFRLLINFNCYFSVLFFNAYWLCYVVWC